MLDRQAFLHPTVNQLDIEKKIVFCAVFTIFFALMKTGFRIFALRMSKSRTWCSSYGRHHSCWPVWWDAPAPSRLRGCRTALVDMSAGNTDVCNAECVRLAVEHQTMEALFSICCSRQNLCFSLTWLRIKRLTQWKTEKYLSDFFFKCGLTHKPL